MTGSWPAVAAGGNIQTAVGTDFSSSSSHTGTTGQARAGTTSTALIQQTGASLGQKRPCLILGVSFWLKNYLYVPEVALFSSQDSFKVDIHNHDKNAYNKNVVI